MSEDDQYEGVVSSLDVLLLEARTAVAASGRSLAAELMVLAKCDSGLLERTAHVALGVRFVGAAALARCTADFHLLGVTECIERTIFPARIDGQPMFVVIDPWDQLARQWLANRTGRYPSLAWGERDALQAALQVARQRLNASTGLASARAGHAAESGDTTLGAISIESIERSNSPIVRFVDAAIYDAWKAGASDIHFECDRNGVRVKLRLDGVLVTGANLADRIQAEETISRIKVLAQLDIAERRVPQDGRFRLQVGERELDFRVSIMPSIFGEDAVVRLLDKAHLSGTAQAISLGSLGLGADAIARIRHLAQRPHGMLLVTGPTGSGKTTTLYAALTEIQSGQDKTITIEDPVEYELPGVLQIPVNEKKGLTFSQGLRSILRHDPDKILVGEIRDAETAEIAVQAALTGHLVFTTVHANSVFDVISRFAHMDVDMYSLMSALNGVVAQRLVRCNCPGCSDVDPAFPNSGLERMQAAGIDLVTITPRRGRGCELCRQTGYKGRQAIAEVLTLDDRLRALILNRADVAEVKRLARERGVRPLSTLALDLVAAGLTTFEEIDRVVAYE